MKTASPAAPEFGARYAVVRKLGEGGMGIVYEAIDKERAVPVALKTAPFVAAALYRFKQEFRAVAEVSHPNLVALYDLVTENDRAFFTMELVTGENFLTHVRGAQVAPFADTLIDTPRSGERMVSDRPPAITSRALACDVKKLRPALLQLASGVAALHAAGKLHRDIKPSNVLVTREGRVVLLDFGLATDVAQDFRATLGERVVGTPEYMSPEQAASGELTEASDWYSVGVMLFEALTGAVPFRGSFVHVLSAKQRETPPAPSELVGGVPGDLDMLCSELLRHEPGERPSGEELLARLGGSPGAPTRAKSATATGTHAAPFVGREGLTRALEEAFSASEQGRTVLVHVHGSSGMGKSALLSRFTDELGARGRAVVLSGRCYERESMSFKAFDGLIDALTRYLRALPEEKVNALLPVDVVALARVFPVLDRVEQVAASPRRVLETRDAHELRRKAMSALRELVTRIAQRTPLVLWIDDLQWGDVDSAALLGELYRPPDPPPLLVLLSYRTEEAEVSPLLTALRDKKLYDTSAAEVRELEVGPLDASDAARLAAMLLGGEVDARAKTVARESQGSPYFVDELVRYVEAGEALGGDAPVRLDDALHRRIARLPDDAGRLLQMVAIAGGNIDEDVALRTAEIAREATRKTLSLLRVEHFVRGTRGGSSLDTFHDRVRETVLAHLEEETTKRLHQRLAVALLAAGETDPDVLVEHFRAAGDRERESGFAVAAGDKAMQALAFDRAAALFARAIRLGVASGQRLAVQTALGECLAAAGRGVEAASAFGEAARSPWAEVSREQRLDLQRRCAEELIGAGMLDEGLDAGKAVLREVGLRAPSGIWMIVVWLLAARLFLAVRGMSCRLREAPREALFRHDACVGVARGIGAVDSLLASYLQTRSLLFALSAGDARRIAQGFAHDAIFAGAAGAKGRRRVERLSSRAFDLATAIDDTATLGSVKSSVGFVTFMLGDFPGALALADEAKELLVRCGSGTFWYLRNAHVVGNWALSWLGHLAELEQRVRARTLEAERRGDLYELFLLATGQPALAWLRGGDSVAARARAEDVSSRWTRASYHNQHYWCLLSLARLDLYEGNGAAALRRIDSDWGRAWRALVFVTQIVYMEALHLRGSACLAAATGRPGTEREALLKRALRDAGTLARSREPYAPGFAAILRAGAHALRGRTEAAVSCAGDAELAFEKASMKLHVAASQWSRGALLGGDEGAALVARARTTFESEGVKRPERFAAMLAPGFEGGG